MAATAFQLAVLLAAAGLVHAQDDDSQLFDLRFSLPASAQACQPFMIRYQTFPAFTVRSTVPVDLTLYIGTADGAQTAPITGQALLSAGNFSVSSLAVMPGRYIIAGTDNQGFKINGQSDPFTVTLPSNDAACLSTIQFPSAETSSTPGPPIPVTGLPTAAVPSSPVTPVSIPTTTPMEASHNSGMSAGAKAGIGLAAVLLVFSLLGGLWFVFVRRRRNGSGRDSPQMPPARGYLAPAPSSGGAGAVDGYNARDSRAWKSAQSVDNYDPFVHADEPKSYRTSGVSDFVVDEKPGAAAVYYQYPPHDPTPVYPTAAIVRTNSGSSRLSNPYADAYAKPQSPSSSSLHTPSTPTTPEGANRVKAGSGKGRKPVPSYDASEMEVETQSVGTNPFNSRPSSISHSSDFNQDPYASDAMLPITNSPPTSTALPPPVPQFSKELQHKPSFGEKPMQHILMPDLPPPRLASPPIHMR